MPGLEEEVDYHLPELAERPQERPEIPGKSTYATAFSAAGSEAINEEGEVDYNKLRTGNKNEIWSQYRAATHMLP